MMTICRPAEALVRTGHADWGHPEPDFATVNTAITDMVERGTGGAKDRHAPWTAPLLWSVAPHHPAQMIVVCLIAPNVAKVAADLAQGRQMRRNPVNAVIAELNSARAKLHELS